MSPPGRRRHSFAVMGTRASLVAISDPVSFREAAVRVEMDLRAAEQRFSPFLPDSELSQLRRGTLARDDVSPHMASVLDGCRLMETLTDGAFTSKSPDGRLDTTGFAKGWAIRRAGRVMDEVGIADWLLSVGGDVMASGHNGARPWHVAVRHPDSPGVVAEIIPVSDAAVATSGDYERGTHIWDKRRRVVSRRGSCTVVGPRIDIADALATACWSMGPSGVGLARRLPQYSVLFLDHEGATTSPGFPLVLPPAA